ncbi:hypothetical protein [Actinokineospora sp. NBRC 105648]|uniref:hypothetical protein n=1 Tax=Actinokineospora sp. NBRC 105648 TaxID=3032206 RepID=UPI0024A1DCA9|nr:hypothetical protein [Actinokineospora sp. NBRC 105648]GLZ39282.1 hypothetical protein Acsp05_29060 [Actinokineospora sp. NBRC 105648]
MSDDKAGGDSADHSVTGGVGGDAAQVRDVHGDIYFGGTRATDRPVPHQLPAGPLTLVGRATQLDLLDSWCETATPIIVSHPAPGAGKSALVVHWAARQATRFADGILYFDLRGTDPSGIARRTADVIRDVLRAFGDDLPQGDDAQLALYRSLLAAKSVLLVLDNARDGAQALPLLPPGTKSLAIVTSRSPLADLAAQGARALPFDVLNPGDAQTLLSVLVGQQRAMQEPEAFHRLVELSWGVPGVVGAIAGMATGPLAELAAKLSADPAVAQAPDPAARARAVAGWGRGQAPVPEWRERLSARRASWAENPRVLYAVAAAMCVSVALVSTGMFEAAGLLAGVYFLLRFALIAFGLAYVERGGPRAVLAGGALVGSTVYFGVDALVSIHSNARFLVWLELFAVAAFVVLATARYRPLRHLPRRLRWAPVESRLVALAVLGGVVAWFILLFVGVEFTGAYGYASTFTLIDTTGPLGGLLPFLVIGGLCVVVALTQLEHESHRLFAASAVTAYFAPEVLLLLGSLAFGDQFSYLGNGVGGAMPSVTWLTVAQAVVAVVLAGGTAVLVRTPPHR